MDVKTSIQERVKCVECVLYKFVQKKGNYKTVDIVKSIMFGS